MLEYFGTCFYSLIMLFSQCFPALYFLLSVSLVMPIATADCERSFSDMNRIKSAERSRLKDILNSLMRIYSLRGNEGEFRDILKKNLEQVSKKVAYKLWKREGYREDSYYDNIFIVQWPVITDCSHKKIMSHLEISSVLKNVH